MVENHKGKHRLNMEIIDLDDELDIHLVAPEKKVNADSAFVHELNKIGVKYKLN